MLTAYSICMLTNMNFYTLIYWVLVILINMNGFFSIAFIFPLFLELTTASIISMLVFNVTGAC